MAASTKCVRGYSTPFVFNANGQQTLFPVAVAGTLDVTKILDGTRESPTGLLIDTCVLHLIQDGTAGSTTYEVYRRRAGANTLLATLTIAAASGQYSRVAVAPASTALKTLDVGDKLYIQPTAVGTNAYDATVEVQLT